MKKTHMRTIKGIMAENRSGYLAEQISRRILTSAFPPVASLDLFVTEDCNLRCPYCFIHGKNPRQLDYDTGRAAVDFFFRESKNESRITVLFIGGEPLLNFTIIRKLVLYCRNIPWNGKKLNFNTTTNGTLLNDEILYFFQKYKISILLSVDGGEKTQDSKRKFKDGSGSFAILKDKIPLLKQYQPWLGVRMTPSPETVSRLFYDVKELFRLGANQFIIGPASGIRWPDDSIRTYELELRKVARWYIRKKLSKSPIRIGQLGLDPQDPGFDPKHHIWGCGAGRGRLSVTVDGKIQGCAKVQGLNDLRGLIYFGDVWRGFTNLSARLAFITTALHLREPCRSCDLVDHCAGGCPAVNIEASGSLFLPDPSECKLSAISLRTKAYAIQKYNSVLNEQNREKEY